MIARAAAAISDRAEPREGGDGPNLGIGIWTDFERPLNGRDCEQRGSGDYEHEALQRSNPPARSGVCKIWCDERCEISPRITTDLRKGKPKLFGDPVDEAGVLQLTEKPVRAGY